MAGLDADVTVDGEKSVLWLSGELSEQTAPLLVAVAMSALDRPAMRTLVLDLAGVTFMDSTGISALLRIRVVCADNDVTMRLQEPSERVHRVLTLTGLIGTFGLPEGEDQRPA